MSSASLSADAPNDGKNSASRVIFASFIGTAIEFYDFYVYATAAALVIGPVFFPHGSPAAQALSAFVTFGIAFIARPIGSFIFGHFGDRIGRKSTLVASLLVMGVSTTLIGFVPGYDSIGSAAPVLLCILRFGQGIGLGGEWGGAALLATEYAPPGKRGWFGMFPQLGPSIGFLASNGLFFGLALSLSDDAVPQLGLARAVPRERGARRARALRAAEDRGDAGVSRGHRAARARARAHRDAPRPIPRADAPRRAGDGRLLHALLHFDGIFALVRRVDAAFLAREIPRPACASR